MFTRLAHICLTVKHLEACCVYYQKLGFKMKFRFLRDKKAFGAYLEIAPGNFIELFEAADGSGKSANGHFCLEAEDIDAFIEHCARNNITTTPKKLGCDHTWQVWLADPDGNEFEVHQYTENSSQKTGEDVEADW